MLQKIKENLALIVTGITLLGSIGAGFQSVSNIINTLTGIDERMNNIEYEFYISSCKRGMLRIRHKWK